MADNARQLYSAAYNRTQTTDLHNRYEDASNPVKLEPAEKWAEQAREYIGKRTEPRDDFSQHMETVRRRTQEEFKQQQATNPDGALQPKKLSEHRRKHLHLYSNKPGSGQPAAKTRYRSQSPHGIEVQSARLRQNDYPRGADNEQIDGQQRQIIAQKHITKTYRYGKEQNIEVEEIEEIDYKMVGGRRSPAKMSEAIQNRQYYPKPSEFREDLILEDQRESQTRYKSRSKRNSERTERAQAMGHESVFRKLHDKAQHLYSNLNAQTGNNSRPTKGDSQSKQHVGHDGSISNNSNSVDSQSQLYLGQGKEAEDKKKATGQRTQTQYYVPQGQRLVDQKLEQIRKRGRQIQQQIQTQAQQQITNVPGTSPFQGGMGASSNFDVNRSTDMKNFNFGQPPSGPSTPIQELPRGKYYEQSGRETFGSAKPQGITLMQTQTARADSGLRKETPQYNNSQLPSMQPVRPQPIPQPTNEDEVPQVFQMLRNEQGKFAETIARETRQKEQLPEALQLLQNDQQNFMGLMKKEIGQQRYQEPQKDRPEEPRSNRSGVFGGGQGNSSPEKQMPEFMNELKQNNKQLQDVIIGKKPAMGRTQPTRLSYQSDEQFEDSDNESPRINTAAAKQNLQQQRIKKGEQLMNILENRNDSGGNRSMDSDLAGGSIIDDLGKGNSLMQQQTSNPTSYKHSEFQQYGNNSSGLGVGGQISIQSVQQNKIVGPPSITIQPPSPDQTTMPMGGPPGQHVPNSQPVALQQPIQGQPIGGPRGNNHIPIAGNKTITLGPGSAGPSTASNVSPLVQVQHSRSQSPVRTSGVGVPQPVFYSPPHATVANAQPTKALNEKMMDLVQMTSGAHPPGQTTTTTVRRSNVFDPSTSGYNVLPHELPMSDKALPVKHMGAPQLAPPAVGAVPVPGQIVGTPTISTSRVLLPGGMQQTTTTTTTQQIVQLGNGIVPGETITTSRVRGSRVAPPNPLSTLQPSQFAPDTERRLIPPTQVSTLPGQINSNTVSISQIPPVVVPKKTGTCMACCGRCTIF